VKTVDNLIGVAENGTIFSTYGPTPTHRKSLRQAKLKLEQEKTRLRNIIEKQIPALEKKLKAKGAPYVTGQNLP